MAKRKQERRRAKERRHEYEEVWLDADGNELAPEEVDPVVTASAAKTPAQAKGKGKSAPSRGRGRIAQPPSWRRVGKRALIFAPLMFVTVYLIGGSKLTLAGKLLQTVVLLAFFVPFSYAMDSIGYRSYQKRLGQTDKPKQKP
jgi:hypothetical protein